MAKQRNAAVKEKIKNAEKIIQSYAYGQDLDQAIRYLKAHDPDNRVLASIKDFEGNRPMLKTLNALYRADEARKNNDTAELEKIAEFLGNKRRSKDARAEAERIKEELSATQAAETDDNAPKQQVEEKEVVPAQKKKMTDDEIYANANEINDIVEGAEFREYMAKEVVEPLKKQVTVVDENGEEIDVKTADNLWKVKMQAALHAITMAHMDSARFAAKKKEEKIVQLKESATEMFWTSLAGVVAESKVDPNKSAEENDKNRNNAIITFASGKKVTAKADCFVDSIVSTKRAMDRKAAALAESGNNKSGKWWKGIAQNFGKFIKRYIGEPAEIKQAAIGYFSSARGKTNVAATAALTASAFFSLPVALGAAAGYGLYHAVSAPLWAIAEKKNANLKAAKASGNDKEVKVWTGMAGLRNAYKAIQANPKEKKRFWRQGLINMTAGLGSAAVIAYAAPYVVAGGAAALGAAAFARASATSARVLGANLNSGLQMREAIRQNKEDQTAESQKGADRAKGAFVVGLAISGIGEALACLSAINAGAQEAALNNDHDALTTDSLSQNKDSLGVEPIAKNPDGLEDATPAPEADVNDVAVPEAPTQYDESMGITDKEWTSVHKYGEDSFQERYFNTYNAQQDNPDTFVHADGTPMTTVEAEYKSQVILEGLAKEGKDHHFRLFDENHQEVFKAKGGDGFIYADGSKVTSTDIAPECWGSEERVAAFRAIYKAVNCGAEVDGISSQEFNDLYRDAAAGTGNAYAVTNGCDDIIWKHGSAHRMLHRVSTRVAESTPVVEPEPADAVVESEPVVEEKPVVDNTVDSDVQVQDVPQKDHEVDDGAAVGTNSTLIKGTTKKTILGDSFGKASVSSPRAVPNSIVNLGAERGR